MKPKGGKSEKNYIKNGGMMHLYVFLGYKLKSLRRGKMNLKWGGGDDRKTQHIPLY